MEYTTYSAIKVNVENGVAVVALNQPKSMNSLVGQMVDDLIDVTPKLAEDDSVKVVVLTGEGKAFCAGGDLNRFTQGFTQTSAVDYVDNVHRFIKAWSNLKKPTIAAVNGAAVGAGLSLMLMCDMSFVSEAAKIQCAFINMGLVPDCGLAYYLPRIVGEQKAKELILTGQMLSAAEAKEIGLVNRVIPAEELMNEVMKVAGKLVNGPTYALRMSKRMVNMGMDMDLNNFLSLEAMMQADCFLTADSAEAVSAFLEKRKPVFQGK